MEKTSIKKILATALAGAISITSMNSFAVAQHHSTGTSGHTLATTAAIKSVKCEIEGRYAPCRVVKIAKATLGKDWRKKIHRLILEGTIPAVSSPIGFGARFTSIFTAFSYVNHWRRSTSEDGFMVVGSQFGDPEKYVGVTVGVANDDFGFNRESFGSNGNISLQLNRYLGSATAVAIGASNLTGWGFKRNKAYSAYAVITHAMYLLKIPFAFNAGIGTGSYNSENDFLSNTDKHAQPFFGVGVGVIPGLMSASLEWKAHFLNIGTTIGFEISPRWPMFIKLSAMNIAKRNNTKAHFLGSFGFGYVFGDLSHG